MEYFTGRIYKIQIKDDFKKSTNKKINIIYLKCNINQTYKISPKFQPNLLLFFLVL